MGIFDKLFKPNVKKMREEKDVQGLIEALDAELLEVQAHATEALCEMKDERAIQPLIALLRDTNCRFKPSVIRILGEMQCKAATADLHRIVEKGRQAYADWAAQSHDPVGFLNISWKFAAYWEAAIVLANIGKEDARYDLDNVLQATAVVLGIGALNGPEIRDFLLREDPMHMGRDNVSRCEDFRVRAERAYDRISSV